MANSKISALTSATTPLAGTETLPIVQSSATKQVSVSNLTVGRAVVATSFQSGSRLKLSSTFIADAVGPGGNDTGLAFGATRIVPCDSAGTLTDNVLSLGSSSYQFSTIYTKDNLIFGTAAKGINFTANTPAAGMTSQLLNWYEEGTFTPTIGGATVAGTQTYVVQTGFYTRIGNRVNFNLRIVLSAKDAATAGNLIIAGLPFTSNATASDFHSFSVGNVGLITLTALYTQIEAHMEPNLTYFYLGQLGSGLAYSYLQAAAFAATTRISVSGQYMI